MDHFVVRTSAAKKELLDEQAARFIYANNCPFRIVENTEFINFCEKLRPGYTPPNRKVIAGTLLEKVYNDESQKCIDVLSGEIVCMAFDGWSNIRNEPIICACVINRGKVYLVDTIDTSGFSHTGEYLTELVTKIISSTENKFKCKVRSFVTDNAANMAKMRNELEEKGLNVITYGCSAHVLNLLAKDLLNITISDHIIKIVKYFRNTHLPKAWYNSEGGSALVLPVDVRWNSYADCFQSYIKNWSKIVKVCEEHREIISSDIRRSVMDLNIKRNAEHMIEVLEPIACALDTIQKEDCSLAECMCQWNILGKNLEKVLDKDGINKYKARYEQAINACHFAGVLLSPSVLNQDEISVSVDENNQGLEFIKEKCPSLVSTVANFQAKRGTFQKSPLIDKKVTDTMTDYDWWNSFYVMGGKESITELEIQFIYQITTAVASSAGIERQFSSFGIVHSSLRNNLGVDKASKLVFLLKRLNP